MLCLIFAHIYVHKHSTFYHKQCITLNCVLVVYDIKFAQVHNFNSGSCTRNHKNLRVYTIQIMKYNGDQTTFTGVYFIFQH